MLLFFFLKENKELIFAENKYKEPYRKWLGNAFCFLWFLLFHFPILLNIDIWWFNAIWNEIFEKYDGKGEIIDIFSAYFTNALCWATTAYFLTGFILIKKYKNQHYFFLPHLFYWYLPFVNSFYFWMVTNLFSSAMMKKYF